MKINFLIVAMIMCITMCGCSFLKSYAVSEQKETVYAMDTIMDLKAYTDDSDALSEAEKEIKKIENQLKRSDENSEIYKINASESTYVSDEIKYVLNTALDICKKTDGAFDVSVAPIMDLWGFYGQHFYVPTDEEITKIMKKVDYSKIIIDGNIIKKPIDMSIDLGGIAKGYTSDKVIEVLKKRGVKSAVISLGGNIQTLGKKPDGTEWNIGIKDPQNDNGYIGSVRVFDKAVITSGGYQRYFEKNGVKYHHIIDPSIGKPSESGLSSVTIISESGIYADGLSTALFVMGLKKSADYWRSSQDFDAVFFTNDNKLYITKGLDGIFESRYEYEVIK